MSIPAFAVASALEASNVLVDKKESFTIKAIFKTDRFVTNALTALPAIALASLLIIKPSSFTTDIVTCTIRAKPEAHSLSGHLIHDNSQLADQNFINAYCNANLKNYTVDANGIVAPTKPMSYKFVKMFPFHLLTLIIIGGWTGLCWEITSKKRLNQAEYLFDGLEEAAGDLINALRSISHLLAAKTTKKLKKTSQSGGTLARMKANRNARMSHRETQAMTLCKLDSYPADATITRRNNNGCEYDSDKEDTEAFIKNDSQVDMNDEEIQSFRNLSHKIQTSLDKYYAENNIYAKFIEFDEYLETRASSKQFIRTVDLNRLNSFLMTLVCAGTLGYFYIWRLLFVSKGINCKLPEVYWYKYMPKALNISEGPQEEQTWTTTKCYFKSLGTWERFAEILFVLYVFMALFQIFFARSSSLNWKKADRLIKYLPLNIALKRNSVTDLHLLIAKVSENENARKSIAMCDKVLSALEKYEQEEKFLPVLMEVIVWSATDEKVGDIVKKVLQPKDK